jgi:hypothetical protein
MPEIHDEIIVQVYRLYQEAPHPRAKTEALYDGAKNILFKLNRYTNDQGKFKVKSAIAISELESMLNRFYYHDSEFIDRIIYEAKAYIIEISSE